MWRARTPRGAHVSSLSCSRPGRGRGRQMKKRPRQAAGGASEAAKPGDKRPPCQLPSCNRGQPAKPRSEGPPLKSDGPGKGLLIPEPATALWARRSALFRGHTCVAGRGTAQASRGVLTAQGIWGWRGAVVAGLEAWCWAGTGSACSFGRDPQPFCAPVPSSVKWV